MVYKNIGQLCVDNGLVTQVQLDATLREQKKTGVLLGALLVKKGYVTSQDIVFLLAEQYKLLHKGIKGSKDDDTKDEILKTSLTIVDIITTGISPDMGAEIAQIGVLNIIGEKVTKKVIINIKTQRELSYTFKILHKIKDSDIEKATPFEDIIPLLLKDIGNKPLFAYNVQPVLNFLVHYYRNLQIPFIYNEFFDLITLWRRLNTEPGKGFKTLIQMSKKYNCPISTHYDINDTLEAIHKIFLNIITEVQNKEKIKTLSALKDYQNREFRFHATGKSENYFKIRKAISQKVKIEITYHSALAAEASIKKVEPCELISLGNHYFLIAKDKAGNKREFRLNRIKKVSILDERIENSS